MVTDTRVPATRSPIDNHGRVAELGGQTQQAPPAYQTITQDGWGSDEDTATVSTDGDADYIGLEDLPPAMPTLLSADPCV